MPIYSPEELTRSVPPNPKGGRKLRGGKRGSRSSVAKAPRAPRAPRAPAAKAAKPARVSSKAPLSERALLAAAKEASQTLVQQVVPKLAPTPRERRRLQAAGIRAVKGAPKAVLEGLSGLKKQLPTALYYVDKVKPALAFLGPVAAAALAVAAFGQTTFAKRSRFVNHLLTDTNSKLRPADKFLRDPARPASGWNDNPRSEQAYKQLRSQDEEYARTQFP